MSSCRRRRFIRSTGTAVLGAAAGRRFVGRASATDARGTVVFIYDDGPVEDYTKAFPVHREFDAPACTAAVAGTVGNDNCLSPGQLRELEAAGWEIMSHTVNHCALDAETVTRDVAPDDERLYVESAVHGDVPNPVRVSDGESSTTVRVVGSGRDGRGSFLELDGPVGAAFDADDGVTERYTDAVMQYELRASKAMLSDLGLSVSNFVCPYYRYGDRARELAPDYYVATANGYYGGINPVDEIALTGMNRTYFRTSRRSLDEIGEWLDKVAEGDRLGLLGGHSYYDTLPAERIRKTIRMTRERDIEIQTLGEALSDLGVAASPATGTPTTTTKEPTWSTPSSPISPSTPASPSASTPVRGAGSGSSPGTERRCESESAPFGRFVGRVLDALGLRL